MSRPRPGVPRGRWSAWAAVATTFLSVAAAAGEPTLLGQYEHWGAYHYTEQGKSICFTGTRPIRAGPVPAPEQTSWAMVTHDEARGTRNVVSIASGYVLKPGSSVELRIGKRRFFLFAKDDTAWAVDAETDQMIIVAMKKGRTMLVTGTTESGIRRIDRFSLMGFTKALGATNRACDG